MKCNPEVSIIIPIYNVAPYVEESLRSALSQTYSNIEYILVDDCGTDNSMDIVECIKNENPDKIIRIIKHSTNRGLSAARNTGVLAATGDYVFFMDSDDTISSDCIEKHVDAVTKYDADFSDGGLNVIGGRNIFSEVQITIIVNDNKEIQKLYFNKILHISAWNKLIKTDWIRSNKVTFTEGLIYEDCEYVLKIALAASKVVVIPSKTYQYIVRKNSITTIGMTPKHINSRLYLQDMMVNYISTCSEKNLIRLAKKYLSDLRFRYSARIVVAKLDMPTKKMYYKLINDPKYRKFSTGLYSWFTLLPFNVFSFIFNTPRKIYILLTSIKQNNG